MRTRIRQMMARVRAFFRTSELDRDLDAELQSHIAMLAEDHIRHGMTPEQAERAARLELGGVTQLRETHREIRGVPFLETLLQDLRYTVRTLRRDAGFTTFAILIVGLGIGASSTICGPLGVARVYQTYPVNTSPPLIGVATVGTAAILEVW